MRESKSYEKGSSFTEGKPRIAIIVVLFPLLLFATLGCDIITSDVEKDWQKSFSPALLSGYKDFRGLAVNTDVPWYLFRYSTPPDQDPATVLILLKTQIQTEWGPCYKVILETSSELQLRCPLKHGSIGILQSSEAFEEIRILFDARRGRVTVMSGSFDDSAEFDRYSAFLEQFRKAHES